MSVELWTPTPADETDFIISHLTPCGGAYGSMRLANDDLPFTMVNRVGGGDDEMEDRAIVSVHHFDKTYTLAKRGAQQRHQRMLLLKYKAVDVTLSDGSVAGCDYLKVLQKPIRVDYEQESIQRFVSRYEIGLAPYS